MNPGPQLELFDEAAITPELDGEIRRFLAENFPTDAQAFAQNRHWHESAPAYSLIVRDGGRVLAHIGLVLRSITCGGQALTVAGVQNLGVHPSLRGQGLSDVLVERGMDEARRRGVPFGLLFCVPELEKLYNRMGFIRTNVPIWNLDERGRRVPLPGKNIAMYRPLADQPRPGGEIDLQGRDW